MTNLNSNIEWTDTTWNVVTGCTKVSPGCDRCYAERITERFHGKGSFAEVTLHEDRLGAPLRWRKPRRVFVNSMSDLFHQDVHDEFIARVWAVMALTPQHTYQILTKRHARMRSLLTSQRWPGLLFDAVRWLVFESDLDGPMPPERIDAAHRWVTAPEYFGEAPTPLRNAWLGVSVEDQQWADIRVPALRHTPAAVRFLSCEPILSDVDLSSWSRGIDWVIVGGESGPGARPMHPDWVRSLRDQCADAGVAFFFKQWGEWAPSGRVGIGSADPSRSIIVGPPVDEHGSGTELMRVGKKSAGRLLDGREWNEFPATVPAVTP